VGRWPAALPAPPASEIDLLTAYVGVNREWIYRLRHSPALEVLPVSVEARVDADADVINRD
jgi:hypothetical protein